MSKCRLDVRLPEDAANVEQETNMRLFPALALAASVFALSAPAQAEVLIGLTGQNSLVRFDSSNPGETSGQVAITGLAAGDRLVGIDKRTSAVAGNGLLYGVGINAGSGRIYTIDAMTGAATLVSTLAADPADTVSPFPFTGVSGTSFGVDFNPVPDRLRVTSSSGQNLRINVDTGAVQLDGPLTYQPGDANAGATGRITSVAYANPDIDPATGTTLRGTDSGLELLTLHTDPNAGTLQSVISLPFDTTDDVGYDISGVTGGIYFSFTDALSGLSELFTVGQNGFESLGQIGGGLALIGLAARVAGDQDVSVPEPGTLGLLGIGAAGLFAARRRRRAVPA
jgi:hypothetical protein